MAKNKTVDSWYKEPSNYFPDEILKEFKLGKYADLEEDEKERANKEIRDYVNGKKE